LANDAWRKQYNRRVIVQQARDLSTMAHMGPAWSSLSAIAFRITFSFTFDRSAAWPMVSNLSSGAAGADWQLLRGNEFR
jgi:hypothetical protein